MNFAAALGDNNPHYFDDTRPEGIVAHPMLAVALTWPLSAALEDEWGDGGIPWEARLRQVHYNESIVWHRPLGPDGHLEITGELRALLPHPAGTLAVICYEARDRAGCPVFTEHITGLLRGVEVTGNGPVAEDLPVVLAAPSELVGAWEVPIPIDPLAAHLYDAGSQISFPIHTSLAFAQQMGLPGTIYHGTATLGLAIREVINREGGAEPRRLAEVHCGFRGMVLPGSTVILTVHGVRVEAAVSTVYFEVYTATGERAIRDGRLVLKSAQ
jgi:acyl dehydratase